MCPRFALFTDGNLSAFYAPWHCLNPDAKLILLGLTAGWYQMEQAFRAARQGLASGLDGQELFEHVTKAGSFSGPIRKNLVTMLDAIGINTLLGISSSARMFDDAHGLVHLTSCLAPVFKAGENYSGNPPLLKVPKLREWVETNLLAELESVPNAIIIPLGKEANEAVSFLKRRGLQHRCLTGFPHPSGGNGWRKRHFTRGQERWGSQIAEWGDKHQCGR